MSKTSTPKAGSKTLPEKKTENELPAETDHSLLELFTDEIKDIYWAENHLVKALPVIQEAAGNAQLANAIAEHLEVTKTHVSRLEDIFAILGENVQAKKCDAMEGLTKEGEGIIEDTEKGSHARDLGIILASQKVEHYEIAAYTGLIKLAQILGLPEAVTLLTHTLNEEKESDEKLAAIIDAAIQYEAPIV